MHQRADAEHEGDGADADVAAEGEADHEHQRLERGAHDADRVAARRQADHDAIAWPVPRPAPMYRPEPTAITSDRADDVGEPRDQPIGGRQVVADEVDDEADLDALRIVPMPGR